MGILGIAVGGALGAGLKGFVNAVTKVPMRREPWEYLILGGAGAWVGHKWPQWEAQLLEDINEMRADRNMPPLNREGGMTTWTPMALKTEES